MSKIVFTILFSIILLTHTSINADNSTSYKPPSSINTISDSDSYAESVHMYICIEALKLLKDKFPAIDFSVLQNRIGTMTDYGTRPWQVGTITNGAYAEDREDVVFDIRGPFNWAASVTHFWDGDNRTGGDNSLTTLNIGGIDFDFPNSFTKVKRFIDGQWFTWTGNGYGARRFIEIIAADGRIYRWSYHTRGLINFYKTNMLWLESVTNLLGQTEFIREERHVSNGFRDLIVFEVLGRIAHHLGDNSTPAHTHNDVHVRDFDGGDCYHNYIDDGAYLAFNWQTAKNAGGFIQPYGADDDPIRYLVYTTNQVADHYPSGPDCNEIPQQHFGDNNLPGGTYPILNNYYQQLGPTPPNISDVYTEANYCFNHAIRSTASLMYWFAVETGIINPDPLAAPMVTGFTKNLPDRYLFRGENLLITCNATGSNLNYNWFIKVCDSTNTCNVPIPGIQKFPQGNNFYITNYNFKNRYTCYFYDSLCNPETGIRNVSSPLDFIIGVTVSNQFGSITKNFDFDSRKVFLPNETLRPSDPPISGCPIFLNHNGEQYVYENNILNRAEFPENLDQDIEDNYILKNTPLIDSVKQVIKVAVKETNDDVDYFDEISLSAIDIPPGAELGVTEYNELLIYFPQDFTGPSHAVLSGLDVIEELKFDSLSKKINGTLKDQLHLKFSNSKKNINRIQNVADSVSFIFDPAPDIMAIPDPIKRPGGRITVYDSDGNKKGDNIFAVREKSSIVVMPVAKDINTIEMMFQRVVDLSYAVVTKAYFGGYLKHDLQLVEAIDFSKGNVTELLNSIDKNHHVMDSSSFIELEFKLAVKSPPAGWNRKYLLYAAGTYKKALNNVPQKNAFENTIANNSVSFLENKLMDNFPNPFNPSTIIKYKLSGSSYVELKIYDIVGKEIRTLVKQNQNSGRYEVNFDASDLPSGIYFYKLSANDHILGFKKMMYIK